MILTKIESVPRGTRVLETARTLSLENDSTERAFLLLHGYTGYVESVRYIATRVFESGIATYVPRLPGHGTNAADFRRTGWRDWWRRALDSYLELASVYKRVSVGGLSMGAVLATLIAAHFPVELLALFAPAFVASNPMIALAPFLRFFLPPLASREPERFPDDPEREYMSREYWSHHYPDKLHDLYTLMKKGRRALPAVVSPTLLVVSEADRSVPIRVREVVERRIGAESMKTIVLAESAHVVTDDVDRERVADALVTFLHAT